jgi:hypothetical protein
MENWRNRRKWDSEQEKDHEEVASRTRGEGTDKAGLWTRRETGRISNKEQDEEHEKAAPKTGEEHEKAGFWTKGGTWGSSMRNRRKQDSDKRETGRSSNKDIEEEHEKAEAWTWGGTWGSRSLKNRRNITKQHQGQEEKQE